MFVLMWERVCGLFCLGCVVAFVVVWRALCLGRGGMVCCLCGRGLGFGSWVVMSDGVPGVGCRAGDRGIRGDDLWGV